MVDIKDETIIALTRKELLWILDQLSIHMISVKECRDVSRYLISRIKMEQERKEA